MPWASGTYDVLAGWNIFNQIRVLRLWGVACGIDDPQDKADRLVVEPTLWHVGPAVCKSIYVSVILRISPLTEAPDFALHYAVMFCSVAGSAPSPDRHGGECEGKSLNTPCTSPATVAPP